MSSNQDTRHSLEGEAYQEKLFEDYLRMNPIEETPADKFNEINGTNFDDSDHGRFIQFQKKYQFTVDDAIYYCQSCHCCGNQSADTCNEFCSDVCERSYQKGHNCFYENNDISCKMCVYNDRLESYYAGRDGGYGGNDGGYFGQEEEEQTIVVEEEATVNCERCLSETLRKYSICYDNERYFCEGCSYDYDKELLAPYSEEQRQQIFRYAEEYNLTVKDAIDYQTQCHSCGKHIKNAIFDCENHQYCKKKCFEYSEAYWYTCFREADCKVCRTWQYHEARNKELSIVNTKTTGTFNIYAQMYDTIDMSDYDTSK